MVDSRDVSIVVQGAIDKDLTRGCLESYRRLFPDAWIILSTWIGESVQGLLFDDVCYSEDPGTVIVPGSALNEKSHSNVNRQIVSTKAGVGRTNRKYVLKTRTDIAFCSNDILSFWKEEDDNICVGGLKHRLIICNCYTRNPRIFPIAYHPSDWIVFGLREDIEKYYGNVELVQSYNEADSYQLFAPEVWIFTSYLKNTSQVILPLGTNPTKRLKEELCKDTERKLVSNFIILEPQMAGVEFRKYNPYRNGDKFSLITYKQYKVLYDYHIKKIRILNYMWYKVSSECIGILILIRRKLLYGRG